ncbi:sulfate transporter family-domain-containing protein [Xylaria bambusicola]|uniref:sulfate transporter family-domain-containing protein n=1 Tax=Xylaria bambusicola TaxID=326684 RepID=UPI002008C2A8|nr:sulfate transporter family-domain-containing protein [Xylaria bambusicola]KAI0505557.1 sulfate transporter family-domain-containing protein [Xylaria bambusicola]
MSAPSFGFSWARRSPSVGSRAGDGEFEHQARTGPADSRQFSSSFGSPTHREPTRSFIPGSVQDHFSPIDSAGFARSVREDTAELAGYILANKEDKRSASFLAQRPSTSSQPSCDHSVNENPTHSSTDTIEELSEPPSPDQETDYADDVGPSMLTTMFRRSPPDAFTPSASTVENMHNDNSRTPRSISAVSLYADPTESSPRVNESTSEVTPLLGPKSHRPCTSGDLEDIESQKPRARARRTCSLIKERAGNRIRGLGAIMNPRAWDKKTAWEKAVIGPMRSLPAVIVGLLLNILDALSYGMILFPLGNPVFANLGPAGISIFYVSTIVSQLTFSSASAFKGGVGSELIEVVPFFHNMAATITSIVGEDNPDAVIATTITSFAISSMLTGVVFYMMGRFKLGYIIGFIPRHILIGCIGGVGWFLVATGFEVSARLGEFHYDLDTAQRLFKPDTLPLWLIPLVLAVLLFGLQRKITSRYFLPTYILCIPFIFYFIVLSSNNLSPEKLRQTGWIFEAPEAKQPWWYFWTLYKFELVHWGAIVDTVGAMFALTFFSLLHVPINVPALAQNTGEDNLELDHELKLHGVSNFISGLVGSIQNYLVFANTIFFIRSGGDSRLAGFLLAGLTFVVMTMGPATIGFIPVMMVGTLIFVLGFELLLDALVSPRRKLKLVEYLTIVIIVLTMGIYDFVVGIFVGMILAFVSAIFHASQVSAIRAIYTGEQVGSMVRRNPSQHHYLKKVGSQTYVIKLAGFLFFGTIVGVEEKIRELIADDAFQRRPISYMILDLRHVTGIDFSAAEGFKTISRLLHGKGVNLIISGKDSESSVGLDLRAVGLGSDDINVKFMPDLNSALESSENEQLKTFYANQEALRVTRPSPSKNLDVPGNNAVATAFEFLSQSPRRHHLHEAARNVLTQQEIRRTTRWQSISEPLRLMLQVFHNVSKRNEDFWFRAKPYFSRKEYAAGTVLYQRGEKADGFYLLERGELHSEYETPQGYLSEPIVQGTTCGELPFFSETTRTATVRAIKDCVVWVMDTDSWNRLQDEEKDVAQELLRVSLKLTTERMNAMTNYISAVGN